MHTVIRARNIIRSSYSYYIYIYILARVCVLNSYYSVSAEYVRARRIYLTGCSMRMEDVLGNVLSASTNRPIHTHQLCKKQKASK